MESDRKFDLLAALAYFLFGAVVVQFHEPWRDELQAWLLARDSPNLLMLISNLRYEGHPALWHLCLMGLSRISPDPLMMQYFHLLIATATVGLVLAWAPFSWWQRLCFVFGYFSLFEYSIIARNYALSVLLIVIICHLCSRRMDHLIWLGVALALLCQSNVHGAIVALAVFGGLSAYVLTSGRYSLRSQPFIGFSLVFLCGFFLSIYQIAPREDAGFMTQWTTWIDSTRILDRVGAVSRAILPIPQFQVVFWNTHITDSLSYGPTIQCVIGLLLVGVSCWALLKNRFILGIYLAGTFGLILFSYLVHSGGQRHDGFLFLLWFACFWFIREFDGEDDTADDWRGSEFALEDDYSSALVTTILAIHVLGGVFAVVQEFRYPFSPGKEFASRIPHSEHPLVVEPDYLASSLLGYRGDLSPFFLSGNRFGTFTMWNQNRLASSPDSQSETIRRIRALSPEAMFVTDKPIARSAVQDCEITQLATSNAGIVADEVFFLYRVRRRSGTGWQYGWGEINPTGDVVRHFDLLPVFDMDRWRSFDHEKGGPGEFLMLSRIGGHPGADYQHCSIRRWIADRDCDVRVTSQLTHSQTAGDGVRGFVIGPGGLLASEHALAETHDLETESVHLNRGQVIDFVVYCGSTEFFDQFAWDIEIHQSDQDGNEVRVWHSAEESLLGTRPSAHSGWFYGWGEFTKSGEVTYFEPFPRFESDKWIGKLGYPDARIGWCSLDRAGGHPGGTAQTCAIRRWVSEVDCSIRIHSEVSHLQFNGDGIDAAIVVGDQVMAQSRVLHETKQLSTDWIPIKANGIVDFVVDCREDETFDQFLWPIEIEQMQKSENRIWNSQTDFSNVQGSQNASPMKR
ncbi:MAG: hypothetical protein KDA80_11735, partial [Planctomycetaceae bacterium]|nr:hypothetical protein [Planctomycetaceae bacterium]